MKQEVILIEGGISVDDRGSLRFANDFNFEGVKRFYQVENHRRGFIRAWHGHRNEGKYVWVASGTALIGVVPLDTNDGDMEKVKKFVLSDKKPNILWIPAGNYNGFMSLEEDTKIMFFSTSTLEASKNDDIRKEYYTWDIWNENFR